MTGRPLRLTLTLILESSALSHPSGLFRTCSAMVYGSGKVTGHDRWFCFIRKSHHLTRANSKTCVCVCVCVCIADDCRLADTLSDVWDLEVLCPCTDRGEDRCAGDCLSQTAQALGISMTVGSGVGLSSTHPSTLKNDWSLHFGKPLITPSRAAPEYLACIFTSNLTAALPWFHSWGAQILSALSWVQVTLACDYKHMAVMRAMHKTVHRVYSASPWTA